MSISSCDITVMNTEGLMRDTISNVTMEIQGNPSGKARNVSLKLQTLFHFHAPFFTNHAFILPLMTGNLFRKAIILGGLYRRVPLYCSCAAEAINIFISKLVKRELPSLRAIGGQRSIT